MRQTSEGFHPHSIFLFCDMYWEEIKNIFNMKSFKNDNPEATMSLWKLEMKIGFCKYAGEAVLPCRHLACVTQSLGYVQGFAVTE